MIQTSNFANTSFTIIKEEAHQGVWGVGWNSYGQLGLSHTELQKELTEIEFFRKKDVRAVACGGAHTFIQTSEAIYAFGENRDGRLGLGHTSRHESTPRLMHSLEKSSQLIFKISTGEYHSLFATPDSVFSFGKNQFFQLGIGRCDPYVPLPTQIPFFENQKNGKIISVGVGRDHSLVLTSQGLYGFGRNLKGNLGLGDTHDRELPTRIEFFDGVTPLHISCGVYSSFVLTKDGFYGFGENDFGQLGLGHLKDNQATPQEVQFFRDLNLQGIFTGSNHSIILTTSGLYSFGWGEWGQLGLNSPAKYSGTPRRIELTLSDSDKIKSIGCFALHSIVTTVQGRVYVFGYGLAYRLGLPTESHQFLPFKNEAFDSKLSWTF